MDKNAVAPKKERNALLDFMKAFGCIMAILAHYMMFIGTPILGGNFFNTTICNENYQNVYAFRTIGPLLGMNGIACIAIFTFLTGYWFVNSFKRDQKRNMFGKGKDAAFVAKYACKNYASYWPYILFGTALTIIVFYAIVPELKFFSFRFIKEIILAVPQLLGFKSMGISSGSASVVSDTPFGPGAATMTEGFTSELIPLLTWNAPLWYMFALLVALPLYYAVFIKNEAFGIFGLNTFAYMAGNIWLGTNDYIAYANNLGIDDSLVRLCSPMALGIWGWYIVDYLKKKEFTGKAKVGLNIVSVIVFGWVAVELITGLGGFSQYDISVAALAILVLAGKDSITTGINKVLVKFPLSKYFGFASLGIYVLHMPIADGIAYIVQHDLWPEFSTFIKQFNADQGALLFVGFILVLCIPLYFFDKYVLKKLSAWVIKFTKANEPVVFEEPKKAEVPANV